MGIAYAQQRQIYARFRANTSVNFRTDLDAIVTQVGWTNKVAVSNGYKYSLLSPQGLTCKVLIQDKGDTVGPLRVPAITFQFMSNDETSKGQEHLVCYSVFSYLQVIVGYCQIFISLPEDIQPGGGSVGAFANSFAGGIPRIPDGTSVDCVAENGATINQMWWTCSSGNNAFALTPSFRNSLFCTIYFSFCRNGVVNLGYNAFSTSLVSTTLQIYTLKPTYNTDVLEYLGHFPPTAYFGSLIPLDIDPLVGWDHYIQGQIWDAFLRTNQGTLDGTVGTRELDDNGKYYNVNWMAFCATFYGTLYLRYTDPVREDGDDTNYAY